MSNEGNPGDGTFEDGSRSGRRRSVHVDRVGRPRMTDVTGRPVAARRAVAEAEVSVSHETLSAIVAAGLIRVTVDTAAIGPASVEMEALTAAAVAALTVYDMVREVDPSAAIRGIKVLSRSGGDTEGWQRPAEAAPSEAPRAPRGARVAGRISSSSPRGSGGRFPPRKYGS